jgi:Mce-associated membrane protein
MTPKSSAAMRAMAEQADAEAAEAEALAAAARARGRALRLRLQARAEAITEGEAHADSSAENAVEEPESKEIGPAVLPPALGRKSRGDETEHPRADAAIERDADVALPDVVSDAAWSKPVWYRRWLYRRGLAVVAASLSVILISASLVASTVMFFKHRHASQLSQQAAGFAAAARQGVVTLTSLDFHDAKQGMQRIIDNSTGGFRDDFKKTADDFVRLLDESKVIEQGTVQAAAVDLNSMTNDSAVVLVVSTSEVTAAAGSKRDSRSFRLLVTVNRDGDRLKMSKVEFVL